jgi:CheY-like chemotaxis protein
VAIVTLFGGTYCHGVNIERGVSEQLGYEPIATRIINETVKRFGISEEKIRRTMHGPTFFWNNFTHEREKNLAGLKVVVAELIQDDNKIISGFLSHLVPLDITHALHVCIIANFPYRVEQAMKETGKSDQEAAKLIRKNDEERLQWTKFIAEKAPYDESLYDLVIPMQDTTIEEATKLIIDTAKSEQLQTTALSKLAAHDFSLAARVNLDLIKANHDVEVSARNGEVTISINRHVIRMKQYEEELKEAASKMPGVNEIKIELGPKYRAPAINPMANVELPPKILLVDDEKEFVQTLSERLQTRQLPASVVYDGQQALDYLEKDQPDVMVLDLMMPGIGGIELLRRLKQTHPHIEVIILTGHGSENEQQLAADLGAFAYLQKPVNIDVLAEVMRDAYKKVNDAKQNAPKGPSD